MSLEQRGASDEPRRPTAEEMLARIRGEKEAAGRRGRLRVYMGMAPGVGKTYKMLEEAHRRRARGTDVVIGFVETHGRSGTAALIEGLEVIPRLRVEYQGSALEEMDTDAIIRRHPAAAYVDELAHTNAPGSLREKRWQDVELLRDAGIEVISTCNVQHVESIAEAVETIVGAPVHERIPDAVIESADEIELVDISPRALRQRMRHGNIYPPDRATLALERFFTESNLTALREVALRFVAMRVDEQLDEVVTDAMRKRAVTERVLVPIDERSACRRAIRRGATLASALRAPLFAAVVETPASERLSFDQARDRKSNVQYATDLGAELLTITAQSDAEGIARMAGEHNISHVVIAHRPAGGGFSFGNRRSLVDELIEAAPAVELHVIAPEAPEPRPR